MLNGFILVTHVATSNNSHTYMQTYVYASATAAAKTQFQAQAHMPILEIRSLAFL